MAATLLPYRRALPVYKRSLARVRPYPFHASMDDVGLILGSSSKKGPPTVQAQKPEDQAQVAPTDFGENATNPVFGRSTTWRTFHLGMALPVEDQVPAKEEGRYHWAINADCSVASRLAMRGPRIDRIVPPLEQRDTTGAGVPKFFDLKGALYYLNGRYLKRVDDDDNCSTVGDFGVGNRAVDVCVFASNGLGGFIAADICTLNAAGEDQRMWQFDGVGLFQNADPNLLARNVVAIGRHLYRANRVNQISVVDTDSDPWVWGNWGAENLHIIGDKSSPIVGLVENAVGVLIVLKTDGIYSIPADPTQQESIRYFPFLKYGRSEENGLTWGVFMNDVYVRYGEALYRVTPDFEIEEVGPNRTGTTSSPVKGRTTAFAGHGNFHAYTGMWDPDTDTTFLLKYGAHQIDELGQPQRIEAWHGSVSYPVTTNRITQLHVSSYRAPPTHNRMWIGYRDGSIGYFVLPCVPDAAACEHYRWSIEPSFVVFANWYGGFASDLKPLKYVAVAGERLDATTYATVSYRLDPPQPAMNYVPVVPPEWTELAGNFDTSPSERILFPDGTQCVTLTLRLNLHGTDATRSALVTSLSLRWRLVTELVQVYSMIVLAEEGLICRDGTPLRRGPKQIREHVRAIADEGRIVRLILPDEEVKLVSIIGYGETIGWYERQERWASGIKIQVSEDATGGTYGTYKRMFNKKYGDLFGLKYSDLWTI